MAQTSTGTGQAPAAPANVLSRFMGVLVSPRATFEGLAAHPRWLGMLALVCLSMSIVVGGFMFTQVGQDAWVDAAASSPFSGEVTDAQYANMQRMARFAPYLSIANMLIFVPLMYVVVAGILFAVFNAAMGGDATFKQLFSVIVHTGPVGVLGQLFTMPLNYARGTLTSATNLGVLLPMLDENSFAGRLLGMIDLFLIWQLVVLAIGLAVLYKRRTQPIAIGLLVLYGVIAVIIAGVMARVRGA